MDPLQLNFHHLRQFWLVAREGSLARAAERHRVSQPTLSAQIRALESAAGQPLFDRTGRRMILTETGRMTFDYAEAIFGLGRELAAAFDGHSVLQTRLRVGLVDSVPKLLALALLEPVRNEVPPVRLICQEGPLTELAAQLVQHRIDVILADEPLTGPLRATTFSHRLGSSGIVFCGQPALCRRFRKQRFPACLTGAPCLLPGQAMPLRRALDQWFEENGLRPQVIAEFDDTAMLKDAAVAGWGFAPILSSLVGKAGRLIHLAPLGTAHGVKAEHFLISAERRVRNDHANKLLNHARDRVLASGDRSA